MSVELRFLPLIEGIGAGGGQGRPQNGPQESWQVGVVVAGQQETRGHGQDHHRNQERLGKPQVKAQPMGHAGMSKYGATEVYNPPPHPALGALLDLLIA